MAVEHMALSLQAVAVPVLALLPGWDFYSRVAAFAALPHVVLRAVAGIPGSMAS
jgi:hypothetical protein